MFYFFTWVSELPITKLPMAGAYRKSQLKDEQRDVLRDDGWPEVMIDDLFELLDHYFEEEQDGGNPAQDLLTLGFAEYMAALDKELHDNLLLGSVEDGGLFHLSDPKESIDPDREEDAEVFNERYERFINDLALRYDDITNNLSGGQLMQLQRWRQSLNLVYKSPLELCTGLLEKRDRKSFDRLDCASEVAFDNLCLTDPSLAEWYLEDSCGTLHQLDQSVVYAGLSLMSVALAL